jgi:hypothetical protein
MLRCRAVCWHDPQLLTEDDTEDPDEEALKADPTLATQIRFVPADASICTLPICGYPIAMPL